MLTSSGRLSSECNQKLLQPWLHEHLSHNLVVHCLSGCYQGRESCLLLIVPFSRLMGALASLFSLSSPTAIPFVFCKLTVNPHLDASETIVLVVSSNAARLVVQVAVLNLDLVVWSPTSFHPCLYFSSTPA